MQCIFPVELTPIESRKRLRSKSFYEASVEAFSRAPLMTTPPAAEAAQSAVSERIVPFSAAALLFDKPVLEWAAAWAAEDVAQPQSAMGSGDATVGALRTRERVAMLLLTDVFRSDASRALYRPRPATTAGGTTTDAVSIAELCCRVCLGRYSTPYGPLQLVDDLVDLVSARRVLGGAAGNKDSGGASLLMELQQWAAQRFRVHRSSSVRDNEGSSTELLFPWLYPLMIVDEEDRVAMTRAPTLRIMSRQRHAVRCVATMCLSKLTRMMEFQDCALYHRTVRDSRTLDDAQTASQRSRRPQLPTFTSWQVLQHRVDNGTYTSVAAFARDVDAYLASLAPRAATSVVDVDAATHTVQSSGNAATSHAVQVLRAAWRKHVVDQEVASFVHPPSSVETEDGSLASVKDEDEHVGTTKQPRIGSSEWLSAFSRCWWGHGEATGAPATATSPPTMALAIVQELELLDPNAVFAFPLWRLEVAQATAATQPSSDCGYECTMLLKYALQDAITDSHGSKYTFLQDAARCFAWLTNMLEVIVDDCVAILGPSHPHSKLAATLRTEVVKKCMRAGLVKS